jgi:hypothetical protein
MRVYCQCHLSGSSRDIWTVRMRKVLVLEEMNYDHGIGFAINPLPVAGGPRSSIFGGLSSETQRSSW